MYGPVEALTELMVRLSSPDQSSCEPSYCDADKHAAGEVFLLKAKELLLRRVDLSLA